jgi:recombinational DNA repair protein RecT
MKTLLKFTLLIALISGSYSGYASAKLNDSSTVQYVNEGNFIKVFNKFGEVIYSGKITNTGKLTQLYDFTQLENGIYTIEINKDFEIETNSIQVKNRKVTFIQNKKERIFKPVFRTKDAQLIISKLGLDTNEMKVELYYEGELIYSDAVKGNEVLNRVYKLDENLPGEYSAVVMANDRTFTEIFRI